MSIRSFCFLSAEVCCRTAFMIDAGNSCFRSYCSITSTACGASGDGARVGPEATLASSPRLVSETINVIICALGARRANAPPFTAENALRTEFIFADSSRRIRSVLDLHCEDRPAEISSLTGHSSIAEPPPEIRKITRASSAFARSRSANAARAASRLASIWQRMTAGKTSPALQM